MKAATFIITNYDNKELVIRSDYVSGSYNIGWFSGPGFTVFGRYIFFKKITDDIVRVSNTKGKERSFIVPLNEQRMFIIQENGKVMVVNGGI